MEARCSAVARVVPWAVKWVERTGLEGCCKHRMWLPRCQQRGRETWWLREWTLRLTARPLMPVMPFPCQASLGRLLNLSEPQTRAKRRHSLLGQG